MAEERTRVDFNAPSSLVERADAIADLLDISRTQLLIDALRGEIDDLAADEGFRRRVGDAYYRGSVEFETVESLLGTEEAMRMRLLRGSLARDPPEPRLDGAVPPAEAFYEEEVPEWTPGRAGEANEVDDDSDGNRAGDDSEGDEADDDSDGDRADDDSEGDEADDGSEGDEADDDSDGDEEDGMDP